MCAAPCFTPPRNLGNFSLGSRSNEHGTAPHDMSTSAGLKFPPPIKPARMAAARAWPRGAATAR